jgi:hypothetical protein
VISAKVLLTAIVVWGIAHAWQFGGERMNPHFANTQLYFGLHVTRLGAMVVSVLSFLAVVWFSRDIFQICS